MIEQKKVTVNNKKYIIGQLRASEAQKILLDLLKIVGGFLNKADVKETTDNLQMLLTGVGGILEKLEHEQLTELTKKLFSQVQYEADSNKVIPLLNDYENHFQGQLFSMYELLYKCIEINFEDFFLKLKSNQKLQVILNQQSLKITK